MPKLVLILLATAGALGLRVSVLEPGRALRVAGIEGRIEALQSPGPAVLSAASFDHHFAAADLAWLRIVQELGVENLLPSQWDLVEGWTQLATDLDWRYYTVYHSAAVNLAVHARRTESADRILHKGLRHLPDRWELLMLLAYNAYWMRGDALLGSEFLTRAAELPGAPRFAASLAGRMRYQGGDEVGAIEMLEMFLTELDGDARKDAEERLLMLKSQSILRDYDAACERFLGEEGRRPTARELFERGLMENPPVDLLGFDVELDEKCVARTEVIAVREFEARERVGSIGRGTADKELLIEPVQ